MTQSVMQAGLKEEKAFLNKVYTTYTIEESSQTQHMRELMIRTFAPHLRASGKGLELGCSSGVTTQMLAGRMSTLDVVDGSDKFLEEAAKRSFPGNVRFINSLFETFEPEQRYDYIFATFILEHVLDVQAVLQTVRTALKPDGLFFAVVPNANAFSRRLALQMGLLEDLKALTENDHRHGHRRVYDRETFHHDLGQGGLRIMEEGGLMFKILADFQMDQLFDNGFLTQQHVDGLYKLGLEYPDFSGALYAICQLEEP